MSVVKCPSCGQSIFVKEQPKSGGKGWVGCLVAAAVMLGVVFVVGLLAAIAIPSFVKARTVSIENACLNNMRQIDSAKEQAAIAYKLEVGDTVSDERVSEFLKNGLEGTICPDGGEYEVHPVGQDPECSNHGVLSDATASRQGGTR